MNDLKNITDNFIQLLLEDASLLDILKYGSKVVGNPIMLLDAYFNFLYVAGHENVTDYTWTDTIEGKPKWNEYANNNLAYTMLTEVAKDKGFFLSEETPEHPRRYAIKLASGINEIGFIICLEQDSKFNDDTVQLLNLIRDMLTIKMLQLNYDSGSKDNIISEELKSLIEAFQGQQLYDIHYLQSFFNKNPEEKYQIICIPYNPDNIAEDELKHILTNIRNIGRNGKLAVVNDKIFAFYIDTPNRLAELPGRLEEFLLINSLYAGISTIFDDLESFSLMLLQAIDTANYAIFIHYKHVVNYADNIINVMLYRQATREDMHTYIPKEIQLLFNYDKDNSTNLLETLDSFLSNSCNISKTAESMFLHRNTIVYRINRIQELSGCDLSDVETLVLFTLSLRIIKLGFIS